jgi:hypothetical protein
MRLLKLVADERVESQETFVGSCSFILSNSENDLLDLTFLAPPDFLRGSESDAENRRVNKKLRIRSGQI